MPSRWHGAWRGRRCKSCSCGARLSAAVDDFQPMSQCPFCRAELFAVWSLCWRAMLDRSVNKEDMGDGQPTLELTAPSFARCIAISLRLLGAIV
jgi:hypothetical protein